MTQKKTNYCRPGQSEIDKENLNIENGFYSEESKAEREKERKLAELNKLNEEEQKQIDKIKKEYIVKRILLSYSKKLFDNSIFYSHSNEVGLNWRNYGNELTADEIEEIQKNVALPDGIIFKVCKK